MEAFGIPSMIVSLILGATETLIFTEPTNGDEVYTMKTIMGKVSKSSKIYVTY